MTSRSRVLSIAALAMGIAILAVSAYMASIHTSGPLLVPDATVRIGTGQGNVSFYCEVADTYEERAQGLMGREELAPDEGMLFVFEYPQNATFWMKNTPIPLDIIFIAENGTVLNIAEAVPEPGIADADLTRYPSAGEALWVLEVPGGRCAELGIVPGSHAAITVTR